MITGNAFILFTLMNHFSAVTVIIPFIMRRQKTHALIKILSNLQY